MVELEDFKRSTFEKVDATLVQNLEATRKLQIKEESIRQKEEEITIREQNIFEQENLFAEKKKLLQENKTALLNYIDEIKHFSESEV